MSTAENNVELGLPLSPRTRFKLLRRAAIKLLWPVIGKQIDLNRWNADVLSALEKVSAELRSTSDHQDSRIARLEDLIGHTAHHLHGLDEFVRGATAHLGGLQKGLEALLERDVDVEEQFRLVQRNAFTRHYEGIGLIRSELSELSRGIADLEQFVSDAHARLNGFELYMEHARRVSLSQHAKSPVLEEAVPSQPLASSVGAEFRGSEEVIKERVATYLPDIQSIPNRRIVLDVGCGRGEWLELLKDAGVDAYGLDLSEESVRLGLAKNLDVRLEDALAHLRDLDPESLGGLSAIHVVEHLTTEELLEFLDRSYIALQPGGLLILETPNPDNLVVGASSFYMDPTHRHPLPSQLLSFLVKSRGFRELEIRQLKRGQINPLAEPSPLAPWASDLAPVIEVLNERIYGAEDYAVIGRRA